MLFGSIQSAASEEFGVWNSGWGQGISEYWIQNTLTEQFMLTCDPYKGPSEVIVIKGDGPPASSTVEAEVDGRIFQLQIGSDSRLNTECIACASNFEALWVAIRKGQSLRVRFADKRSAMFSLKGTSNVLPKDACKTQLELSMDIATTSEATLPKEDKSTSVTEIKAFCANKWPTDFRMQKFCRDRQFESAIQVSKILQRLQKDSVEDQIMLRCLGKWTEVDGLGFDYRMVNFCWQSQYEAYQALQ